MPLQPEASDSVLPLEAVRARAAVSSVRVRHAGKVLHTYALDMSGTSDDIARNVGDMADWIVDRATASDRWEALAVA